MNDLVKQFLKSEYDRVSEAHFKSIEAISTFFRYYLLIMAVPGAAVAALVQLGLVDRLMRPLTLCLLVVGLVGLGVCAYVSNLRLDTLLYARTINGIRKAYYAEWDIPLEEKIRLRVLPWSPSRPEYFEGSYFLPVVLVFALIDSSYVGLAMWLSRNVAWLSIVAFCVYFLAHITLYQVLADIRAHHFVRRSAIGVDIDGVLNLQTQHFIEYLNRGESLNVHESDIVVTPVHDQAGLGVTREQEHKVFNNPDYWATMPPVPGAAKVLSKLHNEYGLDIVICTSRPWPETKDQLGAFSRILLKHIASWRDIIDVDASSQRRLMRRHTREWLDRNGFPYQRLYLDKGSDATYEPDVDRVNRFEIARKRELRYFVEDELKKAVKLSYICDVVFLISHPYNEPQAGLESVENCRRSNLPDNLVRVTSWDDIYHYLTWLL